MKSAFGLNVGDRLELVSMGPDPAPMAPGEIGTVRGFCEAPGAEQVWVDWDSDRSLILLPGVDRWRVIGADPVAVAAT
jgi:hypothetical protein